MSDDAERRLFRAYGAPVPGKSAVFRVGESRCQCGGTLVLERGVSVETLVKTHNETPLHQAWRAWRELADG